MSRKYFVTDLDGTLLRSNEGVSEYTIAILSEAIDQGHVVSFATARSLVSAKPRVNAIPWRHPVILYNGSIIRNPVTEEILERNLLSASLAKEVVALGEANGIKPFVFSIDEHGTKFVYHEAPKNAGEQNFCNRRAGDPRFRLVSNVSIPERHEVIEVTYIGSDVELMPYCDTLKRVFGSHLSIQLTPETYIKGYSLLEIGHPTATKKHGLELWASLMGCDTSDITVFGDNLNDMGLFQAGGKRIAVGNAHEQLKEIADEVIGSNEEDAVAAYIEMHTRKTPVYLP